MAVLVLVPAVDVRPAPGHEGVLRVDALVELVVHVLAHVEGAMPTVEEEAEAAEDVAHTALGEVDDASVDDDVRVRPVETEEVREPGHRDAEVGAGVAVPMLVQVD